jgi:hypothetical protein
VNYGVCLAVVAAVGIQNFSADNEFNLLVEEINRTVVAECEPVLGGVVKILRSKIGLNVKTNRVALPGVIARVGGVGVVGVFYDAAEVEALFIPSVVSLYILGGVLGIVLTGDVICLGIVVDVNKRISPAFERIKHTVDNRRVLSDLGERDGCGTGGKRKALYGKHCRQKNDQRDRCDFLHC